MGETCHIVTLKILTDNSGITQKFHPYCSAPPKLERH